MKIVKQFHSTAIIVVSLLVLSANGQNTAKPYGNLKLLEGYEYQRNKTIDTINGVIYRADGSGLVIEFESGISEGYAVNPKKKDHYVWFREQVVNGNKVYLALTIFGPDVSWQPKKRRGSPGGKVLMVTFPGPFSDMDAANFYAEVLNEKEIGDMLLMVLTFDPTR